MFKLFWFFAKGNSENIKILIDRGAYVNSKNNDGETPLHLVAQNGNFERIR